jgi:hypothetical protein
MTSMFRSHAPDESLDPRRRSRTPRTRDWASGTAMISMPRSLQQLLAAIAVRLGR